MGLGGNDGGAHWEVEAQLSGPGDDLDGANRRQGHRRPKVEDELGEAGAEALDSFPRA